MPAIGTIKPSSFDLPVLGGNKSTDSLFTPKNVLGNTTAMKRLVYAPRAYVFVKDSTGKIHNLTHYVVSGNVDRLLDQVSTASVTLRNPNHLFTTHLEGDEVVEARFSPMDPVTIYLRRVRNRAVRVFTGFLDDVPYLQLFPGTVTLKASCTLKRLLHTYFDPALPYTQSFLTSYGWIPYNGQWVSLTGMKDWLAPGTDPATVKDNSNQSTKVIGKGSKITLIGDSIGEGVVQSGKIPPSRMAHNSTRGRPTSAGVSVLRTFAKNNNLTETVVLCLGSNDDPGAPNTFKDLVKQAAKIVGPSRHLIWVNLHGTNYAGDSLAPLNVVLDDVASDNPNMTVIHWNTIIENENLQMDSHGIHTNSAGYARLAREIVDTTDKGALQGGGGNTLQAPKSIDGSLSQLLFATLEHIGHWNPKDIYIEAMPESLFDHLRDLATEFAQDSKQAKEEFKKFITNVIGGSSHGTPTGTSDTTLGGQVKGIDKITQTIVRIANKYNIDAAMAMAVADIESTYGTNMFTHEPYHGWYQINVTGSRYSPPITVAQANDLQYSCTLFCKGAVGTVPASVKQQGPLAWAMATQGVNGQNNPLYPKEWPTAYTKAKKLIAQYGTGGLSGSLPDNTKTLGTAGGNDVTVRSDKKGGTSKATGTEVTITNPRDLINRVVLPIARKHNINVTPESVDAANARHGPTKGGQPSDHQGAI
jgi:lysophospholipase L1-like esterase